MATACAPRAPRVLFLSGLQIHPPRSGGNLRSAALAGALRRHGLDVFVYSMVGRKADYLARRPSATQVWPDGIPEHVDRGALGFVAQYASYALGLPPLWIAAYLRAAALSPGEALLSARLRERLAWCDAVVADFPFLHGVFATAAARGKQHVLSTHNVEHHLVGGPPGLVRALRVLVRRLESRAAEAADVVVSCCDADAAYFSSQSRVRQAVLVPNGVDRRRFAGLEGQRERTRRALGVPDGVQVVLFTGSKWGPNRDAFSYLRGFARGHAAELEAWRMHIVAVGNMAPHPVREPGFTATGGVDVVEPYFAAADAALNPMLSGAGTNVKMCEFLACRLPILTTPFGARGLALEDGRSALLFERDGLAAALARLRRLRDEDPAGLRRMAEEAYAANAGAIDMEVSVRPLVDAIEKAGTLAGEAGMSIQEAACPC
jgi:glycosyltransferase involved in cell wall biosynthesis